MPRSEDINCDYTISCVKAKAKTHIRRLRVDPFNNLVSLMKRKSQRKQMNGNNAVFLLTLDR
jgi:hypothetical protein